MKGQHVGYMRVSSLDQSAARQLDGVELDNVFTDNVSSGVHLSPALHRGCGYRRCG